MRRIRRRSGFGLIEVVILVGVLSLVGLLGAKVMIEANRLKRVQETAIKLDAMRFKIFNTTGGTGAYFQIVGDAPGRLSQLQTIITGSDVNACGVTYAGGQVANWDDAPPYTYYHVDGTNGLATPIGKSVNQIFRNPVNSGGANAELSIRFIDVDLEDVLLLDEIVDGTTANSTAGAIRWTTTSGITTFNYVITTNSNSC